MKEFKELKEALRLQRLESSTDSSVELEFDATVDTIRECLEKRKCVPVDIIEKYNLFTQLKLF